MKYIPPAFYFYAAIYSDIILPALRLCNKAFSLSIDKAIAAWL